MAQPLWPRLRGLVFYGWLLALVRLLLDFTVQPTDWQFPWWFIGTSTLLPLGFIWYGIRGTLDDVPWPKYILIAIILGVLLFGLPDFIAYTIGQFKGWQFGRFAPLVFEPGRFAPKSGHAAPLADSTEGKLLAGLIIGGRMCGFGTVASLVLGTLFIWLPGKVRRSRRAKVPSGTP